MSLKTRRKLLWRNDDQTESDYTRDHTLGAKALYGGGDIHPCQGAYEGNVACHGLQQSSRARARPYDTAHHR